MNNVFGLWEHRHPNAAQELQQILSTTHIPSGTYSEARVLQDVSMQVARLGGRAWRNNVGATPSRCPSCNVKRRPIRYGLANDSKRLNKLFKSSDLILAIPRVITPDMVGTTLAQFGSVECKPSDWVYSGTEHEVAQKAWLTLIKQLGGFATFSTGGLKL